LNAPVDLLTVSIGSATPGTFQFVYLFTANYGLSESPDSEIAYGPLTVDPGTYTSTSHPVVTCPATLQPGYPGGTTYRIYSSQNNIQNASPVTGVRSTGVVFLGTCAPGGTFNDDNTTTPVYQKAEDSGPVVDSPNGGIVQAGRYNASVNGSFGWYNNKQPVLYGGQTLDTAFTKEAPGVVDLGNGTQGDTSGTLKFSSLYVTGSKNIKALATNSLGQLVLATDVALLDAPNVYTQTQNMTGLILGSSNTLTGTSGTGTKLCSFAGSPVTGDLVMFNAAGDCVDTGRLLSTLPSLAANQAWDGAQAFVTSISMSNLTPATVGANHSSVVAAYQGSVCFSSTLCGSANDTWQTFVAEGTGFNPNSVFTIAHTAGVTGNAWVSIPAGSTVGEALIASTAGVLTANDVAIFNAGGELVDSEMPLGNIPFTNLSNTWHAANNFGDGIYALGSAVAIVGMNAYSSTINWQASVCVTSSSCGVSNATWVSTAEPRNNGFNPAVDLVFTPPTAGGVVVLPAGTTVGGTPIPTQTQTSSYSWSVQPASFATSTVLGGIYFIPTSISIDQFVVNATGSFTCSTNPTVNLVDLGTSSTTSFGSATSLASITLTGTGPRSVVVGSATTANHYYGIGFSAGVCSAPPTIDVTTTTQE
jgi:hypothetical protein